MSSLTTDRTTEYARAVADGEIIAGPYVRAACKRHLHDLETGHERDLYWDLKAADRVLRFFENVLTVELEDEEGISDAEPFVVEPWEAFILGSLFGWKRGKGIRRFRRAYVEIGKGNGKSPIAAGIGHYMLVADGKLRSEVYSAATDHDQAMILFRDAIAMYERSPRLTEKLHPNGRNPIWQLNHLNSSSFFKPISSEKKGKSGIRPHCALIDEIHEHPDNSVVEMLRAGTKGNQQALIFEITNSGFDRQSVCYHEHLYTTKIVEGALENDAWFGFICSLDKDDEPFEDESCWIKANPNLGISIQKEYIREQVKEAKGMPSKESVVRRLHFCQWVDAADAWLTRAAWEAVEAKLSLEDYEGKECWLGLDMSHTQDLTALALIFESLDPDKMWDLFLEFWTPEETARERGLRDQVPYPDWIKDGFLNTTPGKVIKLSHLALRLGEIQGKFSLMGMAYDKYRHRELEEDLADLGLIIPMIEHPQGFRRAGTVIRDSKGDPVKDEDGWSEQQNPLWMPSSFDLFETGVIEESIRAAINPVTRWNVASAVVREDPSGAGNRVFDKRNSTGRIDGCVAGAMAIGLAHANPHLIEGPSVYEDASVFM